jgi:N-acetylglucosaminyl-diphospho-decaprenol L-rhamnosyltransferase
VTAFGCVLVTFNTEPPLLRRCLEALRLAAAEGDIALEIVIVDNASREPPEAMPAVTSLNLSRNVGFGAAVNAGLRQLDSDRVLVLNPDAAVDPLFFVHISEVLRPDRFVSGLLLKRGRPQTDAFFDWTFSLQRLLRRRKWAERLSLIVEAGVPANVEKVSGAALIGYRETLMSLGPFDVNFFLYGEDADLSRRARAAGVDLFIAPLAIAHHVGASSQEAFGELVERARMDAALRLAAKHRSLFIRYILLLELAVISVLGTLRISGSSSSSRRSRLSRLKQIRVWCRPGIPPPFDPAVVPSGAPDVLT